MDPGFAPPVDFCLDTANGPENPAYSSNAPFFIVRFNHRPRGVGGVGVEEYGLFGPRVIGPFIERLQVAQTSPTP